MLAATLGLAAPAAALEGDYASPGPNYYFYGPSTNYFGPSAAPAFAAPSYALAYAPAYYGGYYGSDDWDNPPEAYEAMRQDPWHGYNDGWDNGY